MIGASMSAHVRLSFPHLRARARESSIAPLRRAAGAIRLTAQRSIRKRGRGRGGRRGASSPPGSPPRTYVGRLRKSILYAVDDLNLSAVIGPDRAMISRIGNVHEFGGMEKRKKSNFNLRIGGHGPVEKRMRGGKIGLAVTKLKTSGQVSRATALAAAYDNYLMSKPLIRYPARPFMAPALTKNISRLPQGWAGSLRS